MAWGISSDADCFVIQFSAPASTFIHFIVLKLQNQILVTLRREQKLLYPSA
jgi:hypothetical protein